MQNQFKKIMFSVFVSVFVLFGYNMAFASVAFTPMSPQLTGSHIATNCSWGNTVGDRVVLYDSSNNYVSDSPCTAGFTRTQAGTYSVAGFSCLGLGCASGYSTLASIQSAGANYKGTDSFTYTSPIVTPPVLTGGVHFLGATALAGTGSLTNQLTASVGTTSGSLLPVLAVVAGIIFAMIGLNYIFGLMREVDKNKKAK